MKNVSVEIERNHLPLLSRVLSVYAHDERKDGWVFDGETGKARITLNVVLENSNDKRKDFQAKLEKNDHGFISRFYKFF